MKLFLILFLFSTTIFGEVLDSSDIVEVAQREYIHTSSVAHEFVQTYGVYTCVAVVIYDGDSKVSLAHFDGGTKVDQAVKWMIRDFSNTDDLSVSMYGGQRPFALEEDIRNSFSKHGIEIKSVSRNKSSKDSKNIIVNVKTGEVSNYYETYNSTEWSVGLEKVNRLKFGKSIYRHEESIGGGDTVNTDAYSNNEMNFFNF